MDPIRSKFAQTVLPVGVCIIAMLAGGATDKVLAKPPIPVEPKNLLAEPATAAVASIGISQSVLRHRLVRTEFDQLPRPRPGAGHTVVLNLFSDARFEAVLERGEVRTPESFTWFGHVKDHDHSDVVLVVHKKVLAGHISVPDRGRYRIRFAGEGLYRIEDIDPASERGCATGTAGHGAPVSASFDTGGVAGHQNCDHDDGSVIDVLVVYTSAARNAAGGTAAIEAQAQANIDYTHTVFENSGIFSPRLRLVHAAPITYDEIGNRSLHRSRLTNPNDGVMDNAHTLRDEYGADLVTLYYQNLTKCQGGDNDGEECADDGDCPDGTCELQTGGGGISWQLTTLSHGFESSAFNVVKWDQAGTFAHETGHLLGCGHDKDNFQLGALFDYSWGWRLIGPSATCYGGASDGWACTQDSDCFSSCLNGDNMGDDCTDDDDCPGLDGTCRSTCVEWRTVMAYTPGQWIDNFSNPNILYQGVPTGIPEGDSNAADNAKTIKNSRTTVANFRASHYWVNYNYPGLPFNPENGCPAEPYNTLVEGIANTPKRGTMHVRSTSISGAWSLTKPMRIEAENGSVFIGVP